MTRSCRILHLEDAPLDSELLAETLKAEYLPCEVTWVDGRQAFESALAASWNYDLILADYRVPGLDGEEALALAQARCPGLPFIFLSGHLDEAQVVKLLRQGAKDCVFKHHLARLGPVVRRALQEAREAEARRAAEAANSRLAALLRATLEATSEGVLVVDLAGRIATFNRKFLALCGLPDYLMAPMEDSSRCCGSSWTRPRIPRPCWQGSWPDPPGRRASA